MMVDKPTLDGLLSNLHTYLAVLRGLAAVPKDAFFSNSDKIGNAKYHFVIAVECAIDVANHVIASENYRFPKDNADSFRVLAEEAVVAEPLADRLRAMARFRNRLVHLYADVSDQRVHEYLQESLDDIAAFADAIVRHPW